MPAPAAQEGVVTGARADGTSADDGAADDGAADDGAADDGAADDGAASGAAVTARDEGLGTDAPAEATPTVGSGEEPDVRSAAARTRRSTGTLKLVVIPWARLTVDGRTHGEVDGEHAVLLPLGRHRVELRHPKKVITETVELSAEAPSQELRFDALSE
jgi:hypothetical protein